MASSILQPCLRWLERQLQPVCSAEALVTVTPVQLLLCAPLSLLSCLGDVCWSSYWNGAFPQFQSYLCPALQKASGALLSRKSV